MATRSTDSAHNGGDIGAPSTTATAVPHLSIAERVARGKAARAEVPRTSRRLPARARPPRPGRDARVSGRDARAGTRPDPLRPDDGVSPFTFYRGAAMIMAVRPRGDAELRADRAVLRRRAPVELRRLRLAGAPARVRHQRLRRDASGTVGVGRQATRDEHADRRARQLVYAAKDQERIVLDTVAGVPQRDARVRPDGQPRRLVRADSRSRA